MEQLGRVGTKDVGQVFHRHKFCAPFATSGGWNTTQWQPRWTACC